MSLCGNDFYGPYYADDTDFDDYPVDERGRLDITEIIKGIDLAPIVERFDPDQDDATDDHGHMAAIGVTTDVVSGPWCDLTIAETDVHTYRVDDDGTETPELVMSPHVIDGPTNLPVYVDEDHKLALVENIADQALEEAGWERIGPWELTDSAFYAPVTRA